MPEVAKRIIALLSYVLKQWMRLNDKQESVDLIHFTLVCQVESQHSILDI
jgi:hypothetical protein